MPSGKERLQEYVFFIDRSKHLVSSFYVQVIYYFIFTPRQIISDFEQSENNEENEGSLDEVQRREELSENTVGTGTQTCQENQTVSTQTRFINISRGKSRMTFLYGMKT